MSLSVIEVLQNAQINLVNNRRQEFCFQIGKSQLENAIAQLEKNSDASAEFTEGETAKSEDSHE
jgi:hypothetical protein